MITSQSAVRALNQHRFAAAQGGRFQIPELVLWIGLVVALAQCGGSEHSSAAPPDPTTTVVDAATTTAAAITTFSPRAK